MTENASTMDRVKNVVGTVFKTDTQALTEDTLFVEDLRAKSMNTIELAAMLENEFGVPVSCSALRKYKTVGGATELMEGLLGDS